MSTKNLFDQLPEMIVISGFDIAIEKWSTVGAHASHRYGEFSSIEQLIRISESHAHPTMLLDTVIHEIMHAIYWAAGVEDEDKEERIVSAMSSAWMQIWRDNPALLAWVVRATTEIRMGSAKAREAAIAAQMEATFDE
jgi:hypothetical protein